MKKIEAFIRPEKYKDVQKAVKKAGYLGLSVTPVKGRGAFPDWSATGRKGGRTGRSVLAEKWKIEIVCSDKVGDGKIFVSPIDQAVRIRTGESGEEVL